MRALYCAALVAIWGHCVVAFFPGFFPPSNVREAHQNYYEVMTNCEREGGECVDVDFSGRTDPPSLPEVESKTTTTPRPRWRPTTRAPLPPPAAPIVTEPPVFFWFPFWQTTKLPVVPPAPIVPVTPAPPPMLRMFPPIPAQPPVIPTQPPAIQALPPAIPTLPLAMPVQPPVMPVQPPVMSALPLMPVQPPTMPVQPHTMPVRPPAPPVITPFVAQPPLPGAVAPPTPAAAQPVAPVYVPKVPPKLAPIRIVGVTPVPKPAVPIKKATRAQRKPGRAGRKGRRRQRKNKGGEQEREVRRRRQAVNPDPWDNLYNECTGGWEFDLGCSARGGANVCCYSSNNNSPTK